VKARVKLTIAAIIGALAVIGLGLWDIFGETIKTNIVAAQPVEQPPPIEYVTQVKQGKGNLICNGQNLGQWYYFSPFGQTITPDTWVSWADKVMHVRDLPASVLGSPTCIGNKSSTTIGHSVGVEGY